MIRLSTVFWLVVVSVTGFAMFAVKYQVLSLGDQLARTVKQADDTERDIRVLAAEWAYMLEGHCRGTVVMPNGQSEITDFGPGDTWYFPRGHGHALQAYETGCHFLLGFDNGHFSEFGTFSITDWMAHLPPSVLSRNLGVPASALVDRRQPGLTTDRTTPSADAAPHTMRKLGTGAEGAA